MKYDPKDVAPFREQVCPECRCCEQCKEEHEGDNHWFLMCPKFFNWRLGYTNWIYEQLKTKQHDQQH